MKGNIKHAVMVLACIALALPPANILAQETTRIITLSEARELALQNNKGITKSKLTLEQVREEAKAIKSYNYPRVKGFALDLYSTTQDSHTYGGFQQPLSIPLPSGIGQLIPEAVTDGAGNYFLNQVIDVPETTLDYKLGNIFVGGVSLTQPIYMGGKITAGCSIASRAQAVAVENIRLTESQVILNTDEAYTMAVLARKLNDVAYSYKELLDELHRNVQDAIDHGVRTRTDLLKVQVKLNEVELAIQKTENGMRLSMMSLCHICGLPLNTPIDINTEQFDADQFTMVNGEGASIDTRPEIAMLQGMTDIAKQNIKLVRSDYMPQVGMFAGYSYVNGGKVIGEKVIDKGFFAVGAMLQVPILTFGERTHKIRSAKTQYKIAQTEQQDLTEKMQLELAQTENIYTEAMTELKITQRSLEEAKENMDLARQQYDAGLEPISQLLEAQAMWQQTYAEHVTAKCQLQIAYTRLLKARGSLK